MPPAFPVPSFNQQFKALRRRLGLTQQEMAARLQVSRPYVWQLEKGVKSGGPKLRRAVALMESTTAPVQGATERREVMKEARLSQGRFIPLLTLAQAGRAMVSWESLPTDWFDKVPTESSDENAFAIEVRGDSMEPHIREGDRLVMTPSKPPVNGDVVVARFRDGGTVLKVYRESDGGKTVHLTSFNPEYPPSTYRRTEFEAIVPAETLVKTLRPGLFR